MTRSSYDRLSRWYDFISGSSERPARMRGVDMLHIQTGDRVLEVGCGTGESLPMLASRAGPGGCLCGLDLSAGMLRVAKDKLAKRGTVSVDLLQSDGTRLPVRDEAFDSVFMSFTLELFPAAEIPILLEECKRVLRPGGQMGVVSLLQTENPGWMERAYNWAHRRWPVAIDCRPIPLATVVENAGLEIAHNSEMSMWGLVVGILVAVKH